MEGKTLMNDFFRPTAGNPSLFIWQGTHNARLLAIDVFHCTSHYRVFWVFAIAAVGLIGLQTTFLHEESTLLN